jgi:hypothetical protein
MSAPCDAHAAGLLRLFDRDSLNDCAAGEKREVTTIYEIVQDADGAAYALPDYQFTCEC